MYTLLDNWFHVTIIVILFARSAWKYMLNNYNIFYKCSVPIVPESINQKTNIFISRTDHLGDVVLSLPVVGLLREYYPEATITVLGTQYSKALLEDCADINHVWDWNFLQEQSDEEIITQLKAASIDVIIFSHSCKRLAKLAKKAEIPCRIGKLKFFHQDWLYYTHRILKSSYIPAHQHEAEWNMQLLKPLGIGKKRFALPELARYIHLKPSTPLPLAIDVLLNKDQFNLILHPGSHGNGCEWPSEHFQLLIEKLSEKLKDKIQIFLTGSESEQERFKNLIKESPAAINMMGKLTLQEFITFISRADGIIVSGTGPLHIGAGLGIKTLGLFPPRRGIGLRRWAPVGIQAEGIVCEHKKLCRDCPGSHHCFCMEKIEVDRVADIVERWCAQQSSFSAES